MGEKTSDFEEETTSIVKIEEMSLEESQLAEQLYNSAGLGPVVEAGLKDYDKELRKEDKLISKVFGARSSDIRSYGEAVAKRVAFAVYTLLNKQYGGKVGDLRSYIMTLQDERDRANVRYDELMGRVVGILGEEYKDLRTDSKEFMERLTTILGEDLKESKIDKKELAEKLADIDGLRSKIRTLEEEKVQLTEKHESQVTSLQNEHKEEIGNLRSQINELDSKVEGLESEKTALASDLEQLRQDHEQLKKAMTTLAATIPDEEIGKKLRDELYSFILEDSKVPDRVIGGVGKFIDFKKYLGVAAERGAKEVCKRVEGIVGTNS
jgi:outer membrane murein-binding lipoprotein Lpp